MIFFEGKRIAILGLGIEGLALTEFLLKKVKSITIYDQKDRHKLIANTDDKQRTKIEEVLRNPKIISRLGQDISDEDLLNFDIIFRSPAYYFNDDLFKKARHQGKIVSSQIDLFLQLCPAQIIGVTGTKGKGTTASLIFEILQKHYLGKKKVFLAGNIGYPAITLIPELDQNDIVVLELSNFQLADITKSPHIAVITNLGVDHLDYHSNLDEYYSSKSNILRFQSEKDFCILNKLSTFSDLNLVKSTKLFFAGQEDQSDAVIFNKDGKNGVAIRRAGSYETICWDDETKLVGRHNLENIAAAALVSRIFGVKVKTICEVVRDFEGLPFRLQLIGEVNGVKFINDSFATNPGPTIAAIAAFSGDKVLILGGSSKNSDFTELAQKMTSHKVKGVVLIGAEAKTIKKALQKANYTGKIVSGDNNLRKIVKQSYQLADTGDIVIFSPACASFDMFKNYKDRGYKFEMEVKRLLTDEQK